MSPTISFITASTARVVSLEESLLSLTAQPGCELVVVGCPTVTGISGQPDRAHPGLRMVAAPGSLTLAAMRNAGAAAALSRWLYFLDSEVVPDPAFAATLHSMLQPGRFYLAGADIGLSDCIVCGREDFEQAGGYDEGIRERQCLDDDLAKRLRLLGRTGLRFFTPLLQLPSPGGDRSILEDGDDQAAGRECDVLYVRVKCDLMRRWKRLLTAAERQKVFRLVGDWVGKARANPSLKVEFKIPVLQGSVVTGGAVTEWLAYTFQHGPSSPAIGTAGAEFTGSELDSSEESLLVVLDLSWLETDPGNAGRWLAWGLALSRLGMQEAAEKRVRHAVKLAPGRAHFHSALGEVLRRQGRLPEAALCQRHALGLDPLLAPAHLRLGDLLRAQGDHVGATASYRRALQGRPTFARAHAHLAELCLEQGRRSEAKEALGQAIALEPRYAEACCRLGELLQDEGEDKGAVRFFCQALKAKRSLDPAVNGLRKAVNRLRAAGGPANPDQGGLFRMAGESFDVLDALAEAEWCYREALRLGQGQPAAWSGLGRLLRRWGRLEEAAEALAQARQRFPRDADLLRDLGKTWAALGNLAEAEASYGQALEVRPDDYDILLEAAITADRQDHDTEALDAYRRALAVRPDGPEAHYLVAQLQRRLGRLDLARVALGGIAPGRLLDFSDGRDAALRDDTLRQAFPDLWDASSRERAVRLLADMDAEFRRDEIPYVLSYGTLLGCVRQGGLIPWDDDMDVSIQDQDQRKLVGVLRRLATVGYGVLEFWGGYKIFYRDGIPNWTHAHRWPFLDIFFFQVQDRWIEFSGHYQCSRQALVPLGTASFEGLRLAVPAAPASHLDASYPGWRTLCVSSPYDHRAEQPVQGPVLKVDARRLRQLYPMPPGVQPK